MRTYRILLQILGVLLILVGICLYDLFSFLGAFGLLICLLCVIPGLFFLLSPVYLKYKSEQNSQTSSHLSSQLPDWLQNGSAPSSIATSSPNVSTSSPPDPCAPVDIKPFGPCPEQKDGHPLQYSYNMAFTQTPGINVRTDVLVDCEREVDVQANGDLIELVFNDKVIGTISDSSKAQMVSDWKRKGFPCSAIVLRSCVEVILRFYRDKRIGNEWRQQDVFALTSYKSQSKQDMIFSLAPGDELDVDEDENYENSVVVSFSGEPIGKFPKKYALKCLNEGAYGVFFEKLEMTDGEYQDIARPIVRIYW